MKHVPYLLWVALLLVCPAARASDDRSALESLETIAFDFQARRDSLEALRSNLHVQAEILAQQIDAARRKDAPGPAEHRLLEKQLQRAQVLENQMRALDGQEQDLWGRYEPVLEKLIRCYEAEIDGLVKRMEGEDAAKNREALLVRFQDALKRKQAWEAERVMRQAGAGRDAAVVMKPSDTPSDLRMKGDLLLDQEEAVRKEIRALDARLQSLVKEERVRKKAEELTVGMHMFNENEELLGRTTPAEDRRAEILTGNGSLKRDPGESVGVHYGDGIESGASPARSPDGSVDRTAHPSLSDLQENIAQLESMKSRLQQKAGSLQEKARQFYRAAEERRP